MNIRIITDELNILQSQVFEIVTENLATRKVRAKFVPRILSEEQNVNWKTIFQNFLQNVNEDPHFLDNVVTGDET